MPRRELILIATLLCLSAACGGTRVNVTADNQPSVDVYDPADVAGGAPEIAATEDSLVEEAGGTDLAADPDLGSDLWVEDLVDAEGTDLVLDEVESVETFGPELDPDPCCAGDEECGQPGFVCVAGYCVQPAPAGRCWTDADCAPDFMCDGAQVCPCPDLCEDVADPHGYCVTEQEWPDHCGPGQVQPLELPAGGAGPGFGTVSRVEVFPGDPDVAYIGNGPNLYRVDAGSNSWTELVFETAHNNIGPVQPHPTDPNILYVALWNFGTSTLHKSVDGGETWKQLTFADSENINSLAIDPVNPQRVWAGTHWHGVYRSLDGGESWGQTSQTVGIVINLEPAPWNPDWLYAGCWGNDGLYRSQDGGDSWTSAGSPGTSMQDVVVDPNNPGVAYAIVYGALQVNDTLYRTVDGGDSWTPIYDGQLGGIGLMGVMVHPCDSQRLFVATHNGILRSEDWGQTWSHVTDGFLATGGGVVVYNLAWMPGRLLAGSESCGLYESLDDGITWHHVAGLVCDNAPDIGDDGLY